MAGKKKGEKGDGDPEDEPDQEESDDSGSPEEPSARAGYIGLGLVGSLVVGFDPLRDAFLGNGSFENAILRFLACVAVCVIGAGTIGRLIDAGGHGQRKREPERVDLHSGGNSIARLAEGEADESTGDSPPGQAGGAEDGQTISPGSASSEGSGRQDI